MTDKKAVIKNADMSEEMQQDSVDCATQALEKYNIEKVSKLITNCTSLNMHFYFHVRFDYRILPHILRKNSIKNTIQLGIA